MLLKREYQRLSRLMHAFPKLGSHEKGLRSSWLSWFSPIVSNLDSILMGESAAILTSCLWTGSSLLFASAGKRIGFFSVNAYRSAMAVGLLGCAHAILLGSLLPAASNGQWFWMGLSGIIGLGVGDFGLFAAYVLIGPRRSVLVLASSPIFASVGAYLLLNETFSPLSILGVAITLAGIFVVLLEREEQQEEKIDTGRRKTWGIFSALIAAIGQGFGVVLSKKGMYLGVSVAMNPLSAALIRMTVATLFVWTCALFLRKLPEMRKALKDRKGMKYAAEGALIGPFAGMTLSMVAVAYAQAGIAQTLMSLAPIIIIPVVWLIYREKTSWRGILGAVIAIIGVAILFMK
jgi:drug/metabolite transporter (DMT)-like permease